MLGEVLDGLERRAASGASAEGGRNHSEPDSFEGLVDRGDGVLRGETSGDDVSAGAASGEPVSADKHERLVFAVRAGGVGVHGEVPEALSERAAHATCDGGAASADSDEKH